MSVRNYAILWPDRKSVSSTATASGGNQLLSVGAHALDGTEHTAASNTERLNASIDAHGLLPRLSGDPLDGLRGDGTWAPVDVGSYAEAAVSFPPTQAEIAALFGAPTGQAGARAFLADSTLGIRWDLACDGSVWFADTMVRPLTGVGTGGGGETILSLTSAPEGGWTFQGNPMALAHGGHTYIGYLDGSGNVKIAVTTAGAVVATRTVVAAFEVDDHDNPTLYVDPINDRLLVFYSKHLGANLYKRVSTNTLTADATLSGGFGSATDLSSSFETAGNRVFTYPSALFTNNVDASGDDTLWLFYRAHMGGTDAGWHYNASSDGGATWGVTPSVPLTTITYSKIESDGAGAIHMACSEHPNEGADAIYHLYRESAAWRKSDGTVIPTGGGDLPLDGADMTEVYAASGTDLVWEADLALDGSGDPVIVFFRYPSGSTSDIRAMYARWDGAAWDVNEIVATGGYIPDTGVDGNPVEVYYPGGLALDHDDPSIAYISIETSGQWEMFKYVTADGGSSWTSTALTTSSTSKQIRPVGVRNQDDVAMIWTPGRYDSYADFSLGMKGLEP